MNKQTAPIRDVQTGTKIGGVDKASMYFWYVPVNHVPARTTFRHGFYNSMVYAPTQVCLGPMNRLNIVVIQHLDKEPY